MYFDVELATQPFCSNLKGILWHYCNARDCTYFSVVYGVVYFGSGSIC